MRIAIDITQAERTQTGLKTYADNIIKNLKLLDKENKYYFYRAPQVFKNKNIFSRALNSLIDLLWRQIVLPVRMKSNDIDLYYTPGFYSPVFTKIKKIIVIHDLIFLRYPQEYNFISYQYLKISAKSSIKRAKIIIATSKNTKEDIIKNFSNIPESKIVVVYAAAAEHFKKLDEGGRDNDFKNKYNLDNKYFLYAGGFTLHKNIKGLLEIFSKFKKLKNNFKDEKYNLVMAGPSDIPEDIKEKIDKLQIKDDLIFPGYIPLADLIKLYNNADMFLFPSLYEGFGLPPLEAMKCGCPVVSSNRTSLPEVVGDGGVLVDPLNQEKYADVINKVTADDNYRNELIRKGMEQARKFSWEKSTQETLSVFNSIN